MRKKPSARIEYILNDSSQDILKEEAKSVRLRIEGLMSGLNDKERIRKTTCIYAGLLTETLLEYEEPDTVMEQTFLRICELLKADPQQTSAQDVPVPAYTVDHDADLGRALARSCGAKLAKGLDGAHEIAIAMIIADFPLWEKQGVAMPASLQLLIESVILALTLEMATQDFCEMIIDDFMGEGNSAGAAVTGLAAVAGDYFAQASKRFALSQSAQTEVLNVMVRESLRHGTPGSKDWDSLAPSNDAADDNIPAYIGDIQPRLEEFFSLIGLEDPLGKAVAAAKAVGRMVAVISVEDIGQIHPSTAKSLAKTGMILGMRHRDTHKT